MASTYRVKIVVVSLRCGLDSSTFTFGADWRFVVIHFGPRIKNVRRGVKLEGG